MSEWRPIEEAPKDGTVILLYSKTKLKSGKTPFNDNYSVANWDYIIFNQYGWCGFVDGFVATCREGLPYEHENPTHWMPLPPPPKVTP